MKLILIIPLLIMHLNTQKSYIINFGLTKGGKDWQIVNDGVMGGLSRSEAVLKENSIIFSGTTSLKNNGGFASLRGALGQYDLSRFNTVTIRFRSVNERSFSIRLGLSELYYKPNYKASFMASSKSWQTISIKLTDFKEFTLGNETNKTIKSEQFAKIIRLGIIVNDKKAGPFEIEIDFIEFT